jgi:hypothetical protein
VSPGRWENSGSLTHGAYLGLEILVQTTPGVSAEVAGRHTTKGWCPISYNFEKLEKRFRPRVELLRKSVAMWREGMPLDSLVSGLVFGTDWTRAFGDDVILNDVVRNRLQSLLPGFLGGWNESLDEIGKRVGTTAFWINCEVGEWPELQSLSVVPIHSERLLSEACRINSGRGWNELSVFANALGIGEEAAQELPEVFYRNWARELLDDQWYSELEYGYGRVCFFQALGIVTGLESCSRDQRLTEKHVVLTVSEACEFVFACEYI